MMKFISVLFIWILSIKICGAEIPKNPQEYKAWKQRALESIEKSRALPEHQALSALAIWLVRLSTPGSPNMEGGDRPIFNAAREAMLSIPGHAKYYGNIINENFEISVERDENGVITGKNIRFGHYEQVRDDSLRILSLLPSAETVNVLGGLLENDYRGPAKYQNVVRDTLAELAVLTFTRLGIANPPTQVKEYYDLKEELPAWKQWYSEIESGRRTFRFIGDDTEYDLRGPVRRGGGGGADRTAKSSPAKPAPVQPKRGDEAPRSRLIPYLAGLLFLAAGLIIYLRGRFKTA